MSNDHALFAPSGISRLIACPGSHRLTQTARDLGVAIEGNSESSDEGTAAHWVAAEALVGRMPTVDTLAPNGYPVTEEMLEGAEVYVSAVGAYAPGDIEQRIECPSIHPECWGTPDYAEGPSLGILRVTDYKFGHRFVDVFENWQLLTYAIGRMASFMPTVEIELQIVQPRNYHPDGPVRTWKTTGAKLVEYASRLREACRQAESEDAACHPSPECYKCPARTVCKAAQSAELNALDMAGDAYPIGYPVDAKALRLRMIRRARDILKQIEDGLTEDLTARIRAGESVPGFALASTAGREKWTADPAEVIALGCALGINVAKPGLITPNQARKAGLPDDVVKLYSARSGGSIELVESADKLARVFKS